MLIAAPTALCEFMCCLSKPLNHHVDNLGREIKEIYSSLNTDLVDTCDYIDEDKVQDIEITKQDLSVLQWNIQGLLSHETDLTKLINCSHRRKLDIILLAETWLTKTSERKLNINGYEYFGQVRKNKKRSQLASCRAVFLVLFVYLNEE